MQTTEKILCSATYCPNSPPRGARHPSRKCLAFHCTYAVRLPTPNRSRLERPCVKCSDTKVEHCKTCLAFDYYREQLLKQEKAERHA